MLENSILIMLISYSIFTLITAEDINAEIAPLPSCCFHKLFRKLS